MNTIKRYVPTSNGDVTQKGTIENPYSVEEMNSMMTGGSWLGGYTQGYGYASTGSSTVSLGSGSSADEFLWPDDDDDEEEEYSPNDDDQNDVEGINGDNGPGGNGSNGVNHNDNGANNNNPGSIENDGEGCDYTGCTFSESAAWDLMERNEWAGGYVSEVGYVGPCVTVIPSKVDPVSLGYEILQNALEFEGTPYRSGGCNRSGLDCSGLVSAALRLESRWATGMGDIPSTTKVVINGSKATFINELQVGDILVWRWKVWNEKEKKYVHRGHCCIYAGGKRIFHAHGAEGTPTGYTSDLETYWVMAHGIPTVYRK